MNEALRSLTALEAPEGGWGGWQACKAHDCHMTNQGLHPESCLWVGLGNKSALVKVSERL